MKNPQQWTQKWASRISQSQDYYRQGVQNPKRPWADAAVAASARRNAGLQAAINDGRIDAGIQRNAGKWQVNTLSKGVANWATASNSPQAQQAYNQAAQRVYNYMQTAQQVLQGMPADNFAQRQQRAMAWMQSLHDQAEAYKAQP